MIKVVDWGFQEQFFVLSDGRIRSQELLGAPPKSAADWAVRGPTRYAPGACLWSRVLRTGTSRRRVVSL